MRYEIEDLINQLSEFSKLEDECIPNDHFNLFSVLLKMCEEINDLKKGNTMKEMKKEEHKKEEHKKHKMEEKKMPPKKK
jgi:cell division FtsZ-interacting protein ZapD